MLELPVSRRLLVVDPCDDCHQIVPGLRHLGWDVDSCELDAVIDRSCDVGLIRLQPFHLERPEAVKDMISRSGTEWIAVLSPDTLQLKTVGDFVCEWFFDFHTLPFDVSRVQVTLGRAFGMARLRGRSTDPIESAGHELLGESRAIRDLRKLLGKLAPTESPVLIRGESGTGKELVARTLHRQSQRHARPFVAINCGAIPEHLIQSELFGHEKGAFTGAHQRKIGRIEAAHGGTLFLDEIGDLPLELQANLLRFLQEKHIERVGGSQPIPVDVRVLAATHVDLEAAIINGRFREDLYYRLNVLQVFTAPLRERHGDMAMLANHFARFYSQETGRRPRTFSEQALVAMGNHDWPGNVRELANRVRRGLVLAEGRQIEPCDLGLETRQAPSLAMGTLEDYKDRAERQALCDVLQRHSNNLSLAAKVLGVSRPTFYRLLHKHQIR
ncbi:MULTISPECIES: sigma-54 dependent transcriptional regulator [Pseudomonas]|uniref:sigma-54 dependent transcriptional regulator n=1 Tax=Pseudomonas TaxID=286 RepID=UPI000641CFCB|nr:sigma-54 dependent transcriptional regulator [Pseudomonas lundensis]NLU02260.1 sigma-54-dependent Fis family transcriptional regulator [Pseudomonas lundensis]NNA01147.1 sigma-54-dependent Fis family transcriptional regulator [Pseudomonas lundensis]NNA29203.1 sigma-54-dependent Fis family transcriptional regulator [Pseudomonas lundensis]NNA38384.1 sigma-54-dependent Fis family transcriptional regulator [Pseudomonas lundensis]OZY49436.1 sigma-54-dependent Fis family transcriptional regulator 